LAAQQVRQIDAQIDGFEAEIAARGAEAEVLELDLAAKRTLVAQGVQSAASLIELERAYHQLDGEIGSLTARIAELGERKVELEVAQEAIRDDAIDDAHLAAEILEDRIADTKPELAELQVERDRSVVRAPIDGIVHHLPVTGPGYVVRPGAEVALIVPSADRLEAVIRVATTDIDQVHAAQDVNVRIRSFNARAMPLILGTVETVAADAFYDEERERWFYEVKVSLAGMERAEIGDEDLVNGMELTAFLQTTPLRPIDYLTAPIADYLGRAFRDR
jgi:HlyD family type I secretion membrane fusion protein